MQSFVRFLGANWAELLALTREHIFLVFLSTGLAILIGVPLGILLTRVKSLQTPILGFANVMQTVPSLALFGLLIPIPFIGGIGVADGDHRSRALCVAAGHPKYGHRHSRHRPENHARPRPRWA